MRQRGATRFGDARRLILPTSLTLAAIDVTAQEGTRMARSTAWRCGALGFALLTCGADARPARTRSCCRLSTSSRRRRSAAARSTFRSLPSQCGRPARRTFKPSTIRRSPQSLARSAPGVTVGNVSGNEFEPDLFYRGFDATAVTGTPQGLAVYQNGTRINEAFGDVVNWDLIPANAIDKTTIVAANPIFGLNALGGAVTVTMKNGFTWQGFEADLRGRLVLSRARANSVRQAVRQLVGLYGGHADQRRRLAGRRSVAAHQLLRRRRLQGERV